MSSPMNTSLLPPSPTPAPNFLTTKRIGATFSTKELERRGLDWKNAMDDYLTLGFNTIRICAYWDDIEPNVKGQYSFKVLDELLRRCSNGGLDVILVVGMKGPRWPEFHIPMWAKEGGGYTSGVNDVTYDNGTLCNDCLDYIKAVVNRVNSNKCIIAWQVENEPMDKAGETRQIVGIDFVSKEVALVQSLDSMLRPIIVTAWCWSFKHDEDVKDAIRHSNILGLDVYSKVRGDDTTGDKRCEVLPKHYKELAESKGRGCWITELQCEPWNPSAFGVDDLEKLYDKVGGVFDCIVLWGFEKWLDLKTNRGEVEMWEGVINITEEHLGRRKGF